MTARKPRLHLSKSLFMRGLQCPKSLYLDRYHPGLRDEITASQQRLFQSGTDVGMLARDVHPGGVEIPFAGFSVRQQLQRTAAEIKRGTTTLYEAAFTYDDVFVKVDILHKGTRGWELCEIKGTTAVKDVHIDDVALQYYVLAGAGIDLVKTNLVHLNNQYVRKGDLEVDKLFSIEDVTRAVRARHATIKTDVDRLKGILKGDMPDFDIAECCDTPYLCDFHGYCWQHIPEDSVFDLKQRGARPFDFYRRGIIHLKDVPLNEVSGAQLMQLEVFLKKGEFIDREQVREFLDTLWYPLYFLDFETVMPAIPPYDGMRPYQQLPFQYSLHYLEREGSDVRHREYLAEPNIDPREEIAERLVRDIPEEACVIAYNASFEMSRLGDVAGYLPRHRRRIDLMIDNMRDLMMPFRSRYVYHWQMKGSASQKAVLPALVPELSYEGMEVGHGGEAMDAYFAMCGSDDPAGVAAIRAALREYCKLDTLGMVRILERLKEMV
jgi:hypothetical protein